jgi:hypothetical protein
VIVYGESSVAILPELVAIARTPDGTFTKPTVIGQSAGQYSGERYGDYFGAARDPSQPGLVWVAGEQSVEVPGARSWSTSVASVQVSPPGGDAARGEAVVCHSGCVRGSSSVDGATGCGLPTRRSTTARGGAK